MVRPKPHTSVVDRLLAFLDAAPDDEVYTREEIEKLLNCYIHSGAFLAQRRRYQDYRLLTTINSLRTSVWGNKRAIANLKKHLEAIHEN